MISIFHLLSKIRKISEKLIIESEREKKTLVLVELKFKNYLEINYIQCLCIYTLLSKKVQKL